MKDPTVIVVPKMIQTTNGEMEERPKCRTTSSDTPTVSEYQHIIYKIFQSSYAIEYPT